MKNPLKLCISYRNDSFKQHSIVEYLGCYLDSDFNRDSMTHRVLKACVCNILINFSFFSPNDSPLKTMKNVFFISPKKLHLSRDIQIFVIFSLSTLLSFKRTNGSVIIFDVTN